jgi:hypothetical protein
VDATYAVHDKSRGHMGTGMSFCQEMVMSYSWKHKINTKILTEAELIGVDDFFGIHIKGRILQGRAMV